MPRRVSPSGFDGPLRGTDRVGNPDPVPNAGAGTWRSRPATTSGRVRHDEKITVYFSTAELLALEQARLSLRAEYGINLDRGRLVREAVAMLVTDLAERQHESAIVRRFER